MKKSVFSRRSFLKTAGSIAITAPFITRNLISAPPSERVRFAGFGAANMAGADIAEIISHPKVDFVAVADVDQNYLAQQKGNHPRVKTYTDYRELLDKEKDIDCLTVSTPDHTHAIMAMSAMRRGIHVYCQKPMAHDIYEVRQLTRYATEHKLVTQMGIQIHSHDIYRNTAKLLKEGIIGKIKETWSWCGSSYGSLNDLPGGEDPIPETLNWDLWLNTAAERPYLAKQYHPGVWRNILDLGTGVFGDMGCHIFDNVFSALELTAPTSIRSEGPAPNKWYWAKRSRMHYVFPGTKYTEDKTINVHWFDGPERPSQEVADWVGGTLPHMGTLFLGTEGIYLIPHYTTPKLFAKKGDKYEEVPELTKRFTLPTVSHWHQFIDAVRGEDKASAGFDFAGPLAEAVLLGSVACRFPETTLKWDAKELKFDLKEANAFVKRTYRAGWSVEGL